MNSAQELSEEPACLLCGCATTRLFLKQGHWVRGCPACRHRQTELRSLANHVERIYDDSYFSGGGAGYGDYLAEADLLTARGRRYARQLRPYCSPGAVLDVGAAAGFLLRGFVQEGWKGQGIEPNARMAAHARSTLGLAVTEAALENLPECGPFDLVSMIQVLMHFVDPLKALETAARVTRPGGLWLFETWNRDSWTARWFGSHWHAYNPPSVLHWFSPASLEALVGRFGFRLVARGRPSKWISGGHARSLLRYHLKGSLLGRVASPALDLFPDRLRIPYPAEDLFWALFRKARSPIPRERDHQHARDCG